MKGLYIAGDYKHIPGVEKKVQSQIESFNKGGFNIKRYNMERDNLVNKVIMRLPFESNKPSMKIDKINQIDYLYIRKPFINKGFIKELKRIKSIKKELKIMIEIPTYPYDQEIVNKKSNMFILIKEKKWRKELYSYVDRIITYSKDEKIFGIKTLRISNGINIDSIKPRIPVKFTNNREINIIAVASFSEWHGYDRFIEGLANYYKKDYLYSIVLHLVGDGKEVERYKQLVEKYKLAEKVIFYGKQVGEDLDKVYDKCDIALDAMGRHRSGVFYNSSLKGKEYAAKGIPSVSGVETEFDYVEEFKYYLRVPADESPINMDTIIKFYCDIYMNGEERDYIVDKIRTFAEENFDMKDCLKPVMDYIKYY